MDIETALNYLNYISIEKKGEQLKKPEIAILKGGWQGLTYEQIATSSDYSTNYLMRDIAPKLWKNLSEIMGDNIGKTNFRSKLCVLSKSTRTNTDGFFTNNNIVKKDSKDWGNALLAPSSFYGRKVELETFEQWIVKEECRLLNIWGLSGSGKTLLMKGLGEQIQEQYEVVIWRDLTLSPSLPELLKDILNSGFNVYEKNRERFLSKLMVLMRSHRCLIMLDGIEAIMQPQALAGEYLTGYEDYDLFFKTLEQSPHQSCLVTTSLENISYFSTNNNNFIRDWKLSGLSETEAKVLLEAEQLNIKEAEDLISYYQGNPAMLIFAAQVIRELFNNSVREFLTQKSTILGEIHQRLNNSFIRLSVLEREILYWLTAESQPMSLEEIQNNLPLSIYPVELIEALKSLVQRSLLTTDRLKGRSVFILAPMIREFVCERFVAQIGNHPSLNNRLNSSLAKNTPIELGNLASKTTHLSQWLENNFELDWQPLEMLFMVSGRSPARLRSAFNFRGAEIVKRFKQIELDRANSLAVLLVVAIVGDGSAFKICAQAQADLERQILPANLKLNLLDASDAILATIQARSQDNYIQLPYFRGVLQEEFGLRLSLNSITYQEKFVI